MSGKTGSKERAQRKWYVLDLMGIGILAAPLAVGSVHFESQLLLAGLTSLLLAMVWLNPRRALPRLPTVGWIGLAWLAWSLLLLAPWPASVVGALSPEATSAYGHTGALFDVVLSPSLTLDRPRGAAMMSLLLIYGLVGITVWGRTLQTRSTVRSPIPFYVVFSGVLVALVCAIHTAMDATVLYGIYTPSASLDHEPIRGPMVNPNHTAALLLLTTCVTFGYWLQAKERRRIILLAACWSAMAGLIVFSGSRANLGLLVASHLYLLWFIRPGTRGKQRRIAGLLMIVGLTAGLALFSYALWSTAMDPQLEPGTLWSELVIRWVTGWHVVMDRPWFGHGPGNFGIAATLHTTDWYTGYLSRAHNLPLQLMAEWGSPVGLALFAVGLWWLGQLLLKTQDTPSRHAVAVGLAAVVVQNMVDFSLLIPGVGIVWVATAAWLSGRTSQRDTELGPWTWQHGALTLTCVGTLAALCGVAYEGDARRADVTIRAISQPEGSRHIIKKSLSEHPADFHLHVLSSAISLRDGDAVLAHELAQRAQALAPGAPTALVAGIHAAFKVDDEPSAQKSLHRLCHDSAHWRQQCVSILIAHRDRGELLSDILKADAGLTLALVDHLRQRGHRQATTKVLTWARTQFPDQLDIQESLVESWLRMPEAQDALDALSVDLLARSAEEARPEQRRRLQRLGYLVQGRLVERERRYLEARHLYEEAASLDPKRSTEPLLHAARMLLRLKDDDRLEELLKQLRASLAPHDTVSQVAFYRLQSQAFNRRGRLQASIRALHNAIRLSPRDRTLYEALAVALEARGDTRGASKARQRAEGSP
jgi:hypothetical protein